MNDTRQKKLSGASLGHTARLRFAALAAGAAALVSLYFLAGHKLDLGVGSSALAGQWKAAASSQDGVVEFSLATDRRHLLRGGDGLVRLELQLKAIAPVGAGTRQPTDFVVVLDRSGSMGSERKMEHAREAVVGLIDRLQPEDRFALVVYDDRVEVPIPLAAATAGARERWKAIAGGIGPLGSTNLSLGLDAGLGLLAEKRLRGSGRLVLISDGLANQGDTSREGLLGRAAGGAALAPLTAVGVGADFDENLMGALADAGGGNFYFLRDAIALAQVFEGELGATRDTVAQAVEVAISLPAGVELEDAAGYPVERSGHIWRFRPGGLFAGQERSLWLTLAVAEGPGSHRDLGKVIVSYQAGGTAQELRPLPSPDVTVVEDEATFVAGLDRERFRRAVVEEEYGKLQQKVAAEVKAGRRDAAKAEIAAYEGKYRQLNAQVQDAELERNLAEAKAMDAKVDDAFRGADQAQKQNSLSKTNQAAGWDKRRAGAKKAPEASPPGGN